MTITLRSVAFDERYELRALLDAYLVELSQFGNVSLDYPYFDAYWNDGEQRWAYFLFRESNVIGFAMVNTISATGRAIDFAMAEFSILPAARRAGLGIEAAIEVFRTHPGAWQLSLMQRNAPGQAFWPRAIATAGAAEVARSEHDGDTIYEFVIS